MKCFKPCGVIFSTVLSIEIDCIASSTYIPKSPIMFYFKDSSSYSIFPTHFKLSLFSSRFHCKASLSGKFSSLGRYRLRSFEVFWGHVHDANCRRSLQVCKVCYQKACIWDLLPSFVTIRFNSIGWNHLISCLYRCKAELEQHNF